MKLFSHKRRPVHLGPYPLERLARQDSAPAVPRQGSAPVIFELPDNPQSLAPAIAPYAALHDKLRDGAVMPDRAPIPADLEARAANVKGACYYLDASQVGIARLEPTAILTAAVRPASAATVRREVSAGTQANAMFKVGEWDKQADAAATIDPIDEFKALGHTHVIAIVVEYVRDPKPGEPGEPWLRGSQAQRAAIRASEIATVLAGYLRTLGYSSRTHTATSRELDFEAVLLACGLAEVRGANGASGIVNPYLGTRYGVALVSTTLELACDRPLAARGLGAWWHSHGPGRWFGTGGTRPGWGALIGADRPHHLGRYPMERLQRVDKPTTVIDEASVPRIPKRHNMFVRAAHGDLGAAPQHAIEHFRMIGKEPFVSAMLPLLAGMVPMQRGEAAPSPAPECADPKANSAAIKALLYYLGCDLVGIGPAKDYCWYSHDHDGTPITPYHKNAIVILIDQGYETMEGASGDDWISGAQSMRAYMRCSLLGGIAAGHIRNLGYSARTHSVIEEDVLHIPIILNAGLGELSRIGELVLNPYVGPRFKSLVITTDLPIQADKPIDFGLQDFCEKCNKCARECPPQAIPHGPKIMFNGYELWKPDVFSCAKYRITNPAGSMCGRCMKTCPWNIEGILAERVFVWMAIHFPVTRGWIARLDDKVGNGRINPVKKWWFDLEVVDGKVGPARRVNKRELALDRKGNAETQDIACFPVHLVPRPDAKGPLPIDRTAGRAARAACESVPAAKERLRWQPPRQL